MKTHYKGHWDTPIEGYHDDMLKANPNHNLQSGGGESVAIATC